MTETRAPNTPNGSPQAPPTARGALGSHVRLPLSRMAIWALVCGVVGLLLTPVALAGIVLGIIALTHLSKKLKGKRQGHGLAIGGIVTGCLGLILGVFYAFVVWSSFQAISQVRATTAGLRMNAIRASAVAYEEKRQVGLLILTIFNTLFYIHDA